MDTYKNILDNKEELYHLAIEYYNNIEEECKEDVVKIIPKSIAILLDHSFIPTPCLQIVIELHHDAEFRKTSKYYLYVNEQKEFIDEFLIAN